MCKGDSSKVLQNEQGIVFVTPKFIAFTWKGVWY